MNILTLSFNFTLKYNAARIFIIKQTYKYINNIKALGILNIIPTHKLRRGK